MRKRFLFDCLKMSKKKRTIYCRDRDTTFINGLLRNTFKVYSGKAFKTVVPSFHMLGHKLGEFSSSKLRGSDISRNIASKAKRKRKDKSKAKSKAKGKVKGKG